MDNCEEVLNGIRFSGCEDVLVGDVLHYSLNKKSKITIKSGIKDFVYIVFRVLLREEYNVEITGNGRNLILFSRCVKVRQDHYVAFKNVTSIIDNKTLVECSKSELSIKGIKYLPKIIKWGGQMKKAGFHFGERMCLCRDLAGAYKDFQDVKWMLKRNNISIRNVVVYCDVLPIDCFFVQKFKNKGCITTTYQHASFKLDNNAWAYQKSKSDYFLADSEVSCDDARCAGFKGNLIAVGAPQQFNNPKIVIHGPYKIDKFGIVMNSSLEPIEDNIEMLMVVQAYCKKAGKQLFIKYHPSDKVRNYSAYIDNTVVKRQYFKEISIDDFLDRIDVTVVSTSSVFTTSLSKNIPSLIFVRNGFDYKRFRGTEELKFSDEITFKDKLQKIQCGFTEVMERQNAYLNVLGVIKDNYRKAYQEIGIV